MTDQGLKTLRARVMESYTHPPGPSVGSNADIWYRWFLKQIDRAIEDQKDPARCKNCRWWLSGVCDRVDSLPPGLASVDASACDDTGLVAKLMTDPEFGCVQFETRE